MVVRIYSGIVLKDILIKQEFNPGNKYGISLLFFNIIFFIFIIIAISSSSIILIFVVSTDIINIITGYFFISTIS